MPFVDMFIDEPAASKVNRDMSTPIVWRGVFPASTTQLNEDQSLNLDATGAHLERLIESGVTGLVMCGSLGENQCLSTEEKDRRSEKWTLHPMVPSIEIKFNI